MLEEESKCSVDQYVPVLNVDTSQEGRLNALASHFRSRFNTEPSFFVRVPGRVNIIGEHVDYCGYAVCPMAIEQSILVAAAVTEKNELRLTNVDSQYSDFQCDHFSDISEMQLDCDPTWYKYFLCGVKGAIEVIPKSKILSGILVAVWGNIPANAGLSSSSALVSAAVLTIMNASSFNLPKNDLANISAKAERYIGTQGGGMDQAIAFLGKSGCAKLIEFNPLRTTDVILPKNAVFVIAHSLTFHNKALTTDFNQRVLECRLAAQILAKRQGLDWKSVEQLITVQKLSGKSLKEMAELVLSELKEEPYTPVEICDVLETDILETSSISSLDISQTFKLRQRALHVFQEADRVSAFQRINEDESLEECEKFRQLGMLMLESHNSLRDLYECSHPMLDILVKTAIDCKAFGARLTGAGWGGCVVAITKRSDATEFVDALKEKFYREKNMTDVAIKSLIFPTEPNPGATIYIP